MTHVQNRNHDHLYVTARSVPELAGIHQKVAQVVYYTLRIGSLRAYHQLAAFLHRMLTPGECCGLALSLLLACKEEGGEEVVQQVYPDLFGAGFPEPSFLEEDLDRDAALWASAATNGERKAYFAAAYRALPVSHRQAVVAELRREAA